ncbi:hypothetical protein [Chryseobacterium paludis]|uniref:hypothetical protein n=1 Tax=Chryseobacterium paludis TaxID=2956784 RepID=UPI0021C0B4ED|nr:hypothetical protein [Chryseobacterium paludis]
MKKVILVAGILTAGVISANTTSSNNEKLSTFKSEKVITSKSLKKNSQLKKFYPIYYTTSCGIPATTNQTNWTGAQIMAWAEALETNYCN